MTPSADQVAAFQANGGFAPSAVSAVVLGFVFAVLLLWGVWAMRTAYVGWAENRINQRQFLAVCHPLRGDVPGTDLLPPLLTVTKGHTP
jgi:integrating conjugative element protein (TIGR03758 family)